MTAAGLPLKFIARSTGLLEEDAPSVWVMTVISCWISSVSISCDLPAPLAAPEIGEGCVLLHVSAVGDDRGLPPGVLLEYSELYDSVRVRGTEQLNVLKWGLCKNGEHGGVSIYGDE